MFSKAGMRAEEAPLKPVALGPVVQRAVAHQAPGAAPIQVAVAPTLAVIAYEPYLLRAISNLLRNALRYAGDDGPIAVKRAARGRAGAADGVGLRPGFAGAIAGGGVRALLPAGIRAQPRHRRSWFRAGDREELHRGVLRDGGMPQSEAVRTGGHDRACPGRRELNMLITCIRKPNPRGTLRLHSFKSPSLLLGLSSKIYTGAINGED